MSEQLQVAYSGPYEVEIPDARDGDGNAVMFAPGDTKAVDADVAHGLVAQEGFDPVGWSPKPVGVDVAAADLVDGTVAEVLARVGGDKVRAAAAADAERAGKNRTSLIHQLDELALS